MLFYASLIGGWEKLELWGHSYLTILGLLFLVCVLEVILLKLTLFTGMFSRGNYYNPEYSDTEDNEENIYHEDLIRNFDEWTFRQRQERGDQQLLANYHNHNHYNDYYNQLFNLPSTTGIFRFVY